MANLITSVSAQATAEFDLYVKPLLDDPQISALPFDFFYGKMPREVYFNTQLDKVARLKEACGWTYVGGTAFTKKTLTPIEIAAAVEQCYKVLEGTIFANGLPEGYSRGELSPEILDFMQTQQQYAFNRDLLSILFLGDTGISEGTAYYSMLDGVYKKLSALYGGDYDAGAISDSALSTSNIEGTMYTIYNKQSQVLRQIPDEQKVFLVTGTVYDAWKRYLQIGTGINGTPAIDRNSVVNGLGEGIKYNNIPLIPLRIVDQRLNADFLTGSPAAPDQPNRVILTVPQNHKILMDGTAFQNANFWYERKDDVVYGVGSALIDYVYGYDDLNVIAGFGA